MRLNAMSSGSSAAKRAPSGIGGSGRLRSIGASILAAVLWGLEEMDGRRLLVSICTKELQIQRGVTDGQFDGLSFTTARRDLCHLERFDRVDTKHFSLIRTRQ